MHTNLIFLLYQHQVQIDTAWTFSFPQNSDKLQILIPNSIYQGKIEKPINTQASGSQDFPKDDDDIDKLFFKNNLKQP